MLLTVNKLTASAYNLNAWNKALITTSTAKLKQLNMALLKHLLIFIIADRAIIFKMVPKHSNVINFDLFWTQVFSLQFNGYTHHLITCLAI